MNIQPSLLLPLALAGALTACGGGGSDSAATAKIEDAQGFWSGSLTGGTTLNAATTQSIVLPDGTAWMLLLPASGAPTGLVKAKLAVDGAGYSGSGRLYTLATGVASTVTLTGTAKAASQLNTALTAAATTTATTTTTTATLTYSSAYDTAAAVADVAGSWTGSASSGALRLNWSVTANGTLSGTSSTGCTWTGSVTTRTGATAVLDFNATESCVGVSSAYSGVAVLNGAKSAATVFVTTGGDAQGLVLTLAKP